MFLWEVSTRQQPWADLSPLQAALKVANKECRLEIPPDCDPVFRDLISRCFAQNAADRPDFPYIFNRLDEYYQQLQNEENSSSSNSTDALSGVLLIEEAEGEAVATATTAAGEHCDSLAQYGALIVKPDHVDGDDGDDSDDDDDDEPVRFVLEDQNHRPAAALPPPPSPPPPLGSSASALTLTFSSSHSFQAVPSSSSLPATIQLDEAGHMDQQMARSTSNSDYLIHSKQQQQEESCQQCARGTGSF